MLPVSQGTQSCADEAKPEAQATSQTNLGTGMRAKGWALTTFLREALGSTKEEVL
jgi:hypothetical protein